MNEMSRSKFNFLQDNYFRCFENYDLFYRFHELKDNSLEIEFEHINSEEVYEKVLKYIKCSVKISNGAKSERPEKIAYHSQFGWTIENGIGKAYLGKFIISDSPKISIGNRSYVSGKIEIHGAGTLSIESFSSLANGIQIFTSNINHPTDFPSTFNLHSNSRIVEDRINIDLPNYNAAIKKLNSNKNIFKIGNDCWIGRETLLLPGLELGDGCVIGARSVVTKDCKPYGIYAGSPAKFIKYRFPQNLIDELLEIKWWNWPYDRIRENWKFFDTDFRYFEGSLKKIIA